MMTFQGPLPLPQGKQLHDRVLAKTSARTGQLEDQTLDLDARTMAMLGKRQRLSVRLPPKKNSTRVISVLH